MKRRLPYRRAAVNGVSTNADGDICHGASVVANVPLYGATELRSSDLRGLTRMRIQIAPAHGFVRNASLRTPASRQDACCRCRPCALGGIANPARGGRAVADRQAVTTVFLCHFSHSVDTSDLRHAGARLGPGASRHDARSECDAPALRELDLMNLSSITMLGNEVTLQSASIHLTTRNEYSVPDQARCATVDSDFS